MLHVGFLAVMMSLSAIMTLFMARVAIVGRYSVSSAALCLYFGLTTISAGFLLATLLWPSAALQSWRAVVGAGALPALYLHFALGTAPNHRPRRADLWHLLPMLAVAGAVLTGSFQAIDPIMLVIYGVYLWALTRLLRMGPRHFRDLGPYLDTTLNWLRIVIGVVGASLILEVAIFAELARGGVFEASLPLLLSTALFLGLVSYALLGAMGRPSLFEYVYNMIAELPPVHDGADDKPKPGPGDHTLFARVDAFFDDAEVLGDDTLTLSRVSRRLGVPARSVSVAVNRVSGQSFTDLLNDRRITLATRLIDEDPERPLLDIMYAVGFGAKSNFYTQFKRRMDNTPAAFRAQSVAARRRRQQETCKGLAGSLHRNKE